MNRRLIAAVLCFAVLLSATPAMASKLGDRRAQARAVKAQIDALDTKVEIATEDYNVAAQRYSVLHSKQRAMRARLNKLGKRVGTLQTSLNTRVDDMYREGPLAIVDVLLGAASFEDFASTWDLLNQMNKREAASVGQLRVLRADVKKTKKVLDATTGQAKAVYRTMTARKKSIESQLAERKSKLKGVEKQVAALEEEQRRAEAARNNYGGGGDYGGNPANYPRTGVVGIAMKYLGCPYQWAAAGPRRFDCSGFTMYVYRQVGVSLPHSSRAQISCGTRVGRAYLKPGDLVFFGSPIHHVGIYVGGGKMIHAPHSGDVVRISPLHSNYAGACRP